MTKQGMAPWNPDKMSFDAYVENVMVQVERRASGLSFCEDPNNPACKCGACESAEVRSEMAKQTFWESF